MVTMIEKFAAAAKDRLPDEKDVLIRTYCTGVDPETGEPREVYLLLMKDGSGAAGIGPIDMDDDEDPPGIVIDNIVNICIPPMCQKQH